MLRLWPPKARVDEHGGSAPCADVAAGLPEAACFARQGIHLEPKPGGWLIVVDSAVETGKVELFVPQSREAPIQIVSDTRAASQNLPFEPLFAGGHYAEAALVAERELQAARQSATAAGVTADGVTADGVSAESGASQKVTRPEGRVLVAALRQVAMAGLRMGNYEQAESALNEAIALCEGAPAEYAETLARLLHDRAYLRYLYRCTDEESTLDVRRELSRARERSEQLLGRAHPETARIMTSQARLLISEFSYPEAEELLTEALRIRTAALGDGHTDVAESLLELARLNAYRENDDEADEGFQRAVAIREAQGGPDHPDVAEALFHYTDFLMYNRHDGAKADPLLRRALAIWAETIGLDHPLVARESGFIRKVLSGDAETGEDLPDE